MSDPLGPSEPPRLGSDPPLEPVYGWAPTYTSDDVIRRRRIVVIGAVVIAVVIVGAFVLWRSNNESPTERAADLVESGLAAYRAGDVQGAREAFEKAAERDPKNAYAHYNLGLIKQVNDKDLSGAQAEYRQAIAIKADLAEALFNLGIIRATAKDVDEAIDLYRRAIAANSNFAQAHFNLGLLLRERDPKSIEAVNELQTAIILDPSLESRIPTTTTTSTTRPRATTTTTRRR